MLIIERLLKLLNIKFTSKYLKDNILSHPDYPSLLSISDTLNKYNIETLAVNIDFEKLKEVPFPCIVQMKTNNSFSLFVLHEIIDNKVLCYDIEDKLVTFSKDDFLDKWTGVSLLVEASENSKEVNIEQKLKSIRILNILKISVSIFFISWIIIAFLNSEVINNTSSIFYMVSFTILKFIGLIVGVLLLWLDVDKYNPKLQAFCSGGGKKINCNAVLNSKYAKLFNGALSISIIGFSYFSGTLLFLVFNGFSSTALSVLSLFSLLTFSIVLVSIYYQAFVIKQWCKFCVIMQAVLVAEIVTTFFGNYFQSSIKIETLPSLFTLLLLPIFVWKLLKPLLNKERETNFYKRALKKIKHNPSVLESLSHLSL